MISQTRRTVERSTSQNIRDMLLIGAAVVFLILAIIGIISSAAFVTGANLGASSPASKAKGGDPAGAAALRQARHKAAKIIAVAKSQSQQESAQVMQHAQSEANAILRRARARARRVNSSGPAPRGIATSPPAVTAPVATPTIGTGGQGGAGTGSTPGTSGPTAPSLSGIPASWQVVTYNADVANRTADILNRSAHRFTGTVFLSFYSRRGHLRGRISGNFAAAGNSTSVVPLTLGAEPFKWFSYRLSVGNIRR